MEERYLQLLTTGTDISVVDIKVCKYCSDEYPLYNLEKKMYDTQGFSYATNCATCSFRMLNAYINDRHLYTHPDKDYPALFSADAPYDVIDAYKYREVLSEDIGLEHGQEIGDDIMGDFLKLYRGFLTPSRLIYPALENSTYASHCGWSKNLYLSYCVFIDCEDIYMSFRIFQSKNIYRSYNIINHSSNIYNCSTIGSCHNAFYSRNCVNSRNIMFCRDMNNCDECIFSCNQVNKKYMVFNTQYTKEEFMEVKADIFERIQDPSQLEELESKYNDFLSEHHVESSINMNRTEGCNGDATFDSSNCINTHICSGGENVINALNAGDGAEDHHVNIVNSNEEGGYAENLIGVSSVGINTSHVYFSYSVIESSDIYYCIDIENSKHCLLCVGLRNKSYCIFNKQYTKEEYFKQKKKIIDQMKSRGEWGEMLGFSYSKYPYNDTLAYDYFKVHKLIHHDGREEIIDQNARGIVTVKSNSFLSDAILDLGGKEKIDIVWRIATKEVNIPEGMKTMNTKDLPKISDVTNDILGTAIICEESNRPFRIIKQELDFCKDHSLPLPRIHHEVSIDKLLSQRPIGELHLGKSDLSGKDILTVYKQKPKWKVYSHDEYQDFMYK